MRVFRNHDQNRNKYPTVFEEGDWYLIEDRIGGTHEIITAKHACKKGSLLPRENWNRMASDNVIRGYCGYCGDICPDSVKTLWYLYNADALEFYWQKWRNK